MVHQPDETHSDAAQVTLSDTGRAGRRGCTTEHVWTATVPYCAEDGQGQQEAGQEEDPTRSTHVVQKWSQ